MRLGLGVSGSSGFWVGNPFRQLKSPSLCIKGFGTYCSNTHLLKFNWIAVTNIVTEQQISVNGHTVELCPELHVYLAV